MSFVVILPASAVETTITRADAALYLAEQLGIEYIEEPENLYGLAYGIFPGDYDGKNDITNYDKDMTLEIAIVTLVRYAGWNTVQYDEELAMMVESFVTPEGFPYYQPDPTPRSIPYVVVAIQNGLLNEAELDCLTEKIGYDTLDVYINRVKEIEQKLGAPSLHSPRSDAAEADNGLAEFVVMDDNVRDDESLYSGEDTVIDFRSSGLRIYRGETGVSGWRQNYFPLGALESLVEVGVEVPATSYTHQSESVYATIDNYSTTTNAVALWGEAVSQAPESRVWGGFLTATSQKDMDAQLVGLEVDVTNDSLPGVAPNESKVGIQVVALGQYECTNGIELLAAGKSSWNNGILISQGTISENGAVIGLAQNTPIATGIDFSNTPFTNAALSVGNNSKITMQSKSGSPAAMYADDINDGYLVLQAGVSGVRITNNENTENLLIIHPDGTIEANSLILTNPIKQEEQGIDLITIVLCCSLLAMMVYVVVLNKKMKLMNEVLNSIRKEQ